MGSAPTAARTLAVDGVTRVRTTPFPFWPHFDPDEISVVSRVLESGKINYWTGEEGHSFEAEYAAYTGTRYAVALANGTLALELALHALDIGAGREVITTSRTFLASASCAVMRGAVPVMADVDRDTQVITAETIRRAITPRTKAIIAVHLAGWPCDMDPILQLARDHDAIVAVDDSHATGVIGKTGRGIAEHRRGR